MFDIKDDFTSYNQNKIPYSFSVERHTETANLHAGITEKGFALKSVGNRFILNSPEFKNAVFKMNFTISYPQEIDPCFQIIFGYDKRTRIGSAIQITYNIKEKLLYAVLVSVKNSEYTPVSDTFEKAWELPQSGYTLLTFEVNNYEIQLKIDDAEFAFTCQNVKGSLAIDRSCFIGELIVKDITFVSDDSFAEEKIIKTAPLNIPMINGGDIPYTIQYEIVKIDDEYYMTASLDGGTQARALNKNERAGQYVAEIDYMDSPYVGLCNDSGEIILNIASGEKCFVDPNIFFDCQKDFFGNTELPIISCYKLDNFIPVPDCEFIFGYKKLLCKGFSQQSGACEFRFSADGKLTYQGGALNGDDLYELKSPHNKKAISYISESSPEYKNIVNHLKSNHYFAFDEEISFCLLFRTVTDAEYFTFKAEIKNVFETEVLAEATLTSSSTPWKKSYTETKSEVTFKPLPVGVYKIVYTVFYGDAEYKTISHAFEVYDPSSDICPPIASGLPFMFTMNNEQKKLARNGFDLSNPMSSCDFEHYISCATTTPVEAEKQRIWENIKIFGRTWFAWLAIRTCDDYLSPTHNETIKNADFLFHSGINTDCDPLGAYSTYPNRIDHWCSRYYSFPEPQRLINEFFAKHPELSEKLSFNINDAKITENMYRELISIGGDTLIDYLNEAKHLYVSSHNRELEKINSNVKRAVYGPTAPYFSPTLTHHSLRYSGFPDDNRLSEEYFNGFAIFEDYPFSCSYQTYRGSFAVMTLLLYHPQLTIYPELYTGSRGGCIDGAVKYAHAPMGDYECPPYQNSLQAFEYVFNTAHKTKNGYKYWNTYGFHRGLDTCDYINEFVKNWHYAAEHKPVKPLRSAAYIVDYSGDKDFYRPECNFYNQSESGQTIVYECTREAGLPCGFGITFDSLEALTAEECDLLIIPSLANAEEKYIAEIRRLYNDGVNLIALSDISGLEDIFGVKRAEKKENIVSVEYDGSTEYVYNTEASFAYSPTTSSVIVTANASLPVCMVNENRAMLVNTAMLSLGCADKAKMCETNGAFIVGTLIRKALSDSLIKLSSPPVIGKNVGTTLFVDENGRRMLFAANYTPFDNRTHNTKEAIVEINMPEITSVVSDIPVMSVKKNGAVSEIRFKIQPHGFAFIELR